MGIKTYVENYVPPHYIGIEKTIQFVGEVVVKFNKDDIGYPAPLPLRWEYLCCCAWSS